MTVKTYDKAFFLNQPFLSFNVDNYIEEEVTEPFSAKFLSFNTKKIIDRFNDTAYYMISIPNGCTDIFFIKCRGTVSVEIIGPSFKARQLIVYPDAEYFGARIQPGINFSVFTRFTKNEKEKSLADKEVFITDSEEKCLDLAEKIISAKDFETRIKIFLTACPVCPTENTNSEINCVMKMLELIGFSHGNEELAEISYELGYTERYVSRLFKKILGYSPKSYSRIVRFQYALEILTEDPFCNMLNYIYELGYSDQAHFQRDFKEFTGLTPKQFKKYLAVTTDKKQVEA